MGTLLLRRKRGERTIARNDRRHRKQRNLLRARVLVAVPVRSRCKRSLACPPRRSATKVGFQVVADIRLRPKLNVGFRQKLTLSAANASDLQPV